MTDDARGERVQEALRQKMAARAILLQASAAQKPRPKIITESKFFNSLDRDGYERAECPRCNGTGRKDHKDCWRCARRGVVYMLKEEE